MYKRNNDNNRQEEVLIRNMYTIRDANAMEMTYRFEWSAALSHPIYRAAVYSCIKVLSDQTVKKGNGPS